MKRIGLLAVSLGALVALALPQTSLANHGGTCKPGQVVVHGTSGQDSMHWATQAKCVDLLGDDDYADAGSADDNIYGSGGQDIINGREGADVITGDDGADDLYGWDGCDVITGNDGDDVIYDGANPGGCGDVIQGGAGDDTVKHCPTNGGLDNITGVEHINTDSAWCNFF